MIKVVKQDQPRQFGGEYISSLDSDLSWRERFDLIMTTNYQQEFDIEASNISGLMG